MPSPQLTVRPARADDFGVVEAMAAARSDPGQVDAQTLTFNDGRRTGTSTVVARYEWNLSEGLSRILVAEANGELLGFVQYGFLSRGDTLDRSVEANLVPWANRTLPGRVAPTDGSIHELYVKESARGRGVGRALMEPALSQLYEAGAHEIRIEVHNSDKNLALPLYETLGFVPVPGENSAAGIILGRPADTPSLTAHRSFGPGSLA